jgi:hypothetical protein
MGAAIDGPSAPAPPPLRGFAMREPLKANPPVGEPRPRVEPTLAASRRSLTAVSCASNLYLRGWLVSVIQRGRVSKEKAMDFSSPRPLMNTHL